MMLYDATKKILPVSYWQKLWKSQTAILIWIIDVGLGMISIGCVVMTSDWG